MSEKTPIPKEKVEKAKELLKTAIENLQYKRTWESYTIASAPDIELGIGIAVTHAKTVIAWIGHYVKATSRYYLDLADIYKIPEALRKLADELEQALDKVRAIEQACKELGLSTRKLGTTRRIGKTLEL